MKIIILCTAALLYVVSVGATFDLAMAGTLEEVKEGSKAAVEEVKEGAIETGKAAVEAGKEVKEGFKEVGQGIKKAYQDTKEAVKKEISGQDQPAKAAEKSPPEK